MHSDITGKNMDRGRSKAFDTRWSEYLALENHKVSLWSHKRFSFFWNAPCSIHVFWLDGTDVSPRHQVCRWYIPKSSNDTVTHSRIMRFMSGNKNPRHYYRMFLYFSASLLLFECSWPLGFFYRFCPRRPKLELRKKTMFFSLLRFIYVCFLSTTHWLIINQELVD